MKIYRYGNRDVDIALPPSAVPLADVGSGGEWGGSRANVSEGTSRSPSISDTIYVCIYIYIYIYTYMLIHT